MSNGLWRTRWAAIGAAVAVTLGAGGLFTASAAVSSGERTVYVPITPCRIMDTRPGQENRGPRATPIGAGETHTIQVRGENGECNLPADAVGVTMNVTSLNSTSGSFLTIFPADVAKPGSSSLNWTQGQAPTPNSVTSKLAADGRLSFYNLAGTVDVIADVVGYYADHNHDDRYYTKAQVDASLATKANTTDVNAALAGKADSISGTSGALILGPASFVHDGFSPPPASEWGYDFTTGRLDVTGGDPCFASVVMLPQGATVTALDVWVADNSASQLTGWLREDPVGSAATALMATVTSTTQSTTVVQLTDSTISPAVIDNTTNSYSVQVCMSVDISLFSARVSYTNP